MTAIKFDLRENTARDYAPVAYRLVFADSGCHLYLRAGRLNSTSAVDMPVQVFDTTRRPPWTLHYPTWSMYHHWVDVVDQEAL